METLAKRVEETIVNGKYYFNVQYCHPEKVPTSALERAEETAEDFFQKITTEQIEAYTNECLNDIGPGATISQVLTHIAEMNCDHGGFETITCVVVAEDKD